MSRRITIKCDLCDELIEDKSYKATEWIMAAAKIWDKDKSAKYPAIIIGNPDYGDPDKSFGTVQIDVCKNCRQKALEGSQIISNSGKVYLKEQNGN